MRHKSSSCAVVTIQQPGARGWRRVWCDPSLRHLSPEQVSHAARKQLHSQADDAA
jgi:hypothetical protein